MQDPLVRAKRAAVVETHRQTELSVLFRCVHVLNFVLVVVVVGYVRQVYIGKSRGRIGMEYEYLTNGGVLTEYGQEVRLLQQMGACMVHNDSRYFDIAGWKDPELVGEYGIGSIVVFL